MISKWLTNFNTQSDIFELTSLEKFVYAKRLMTGRAKNFIEIESGAVNFDELSSELQTEFGKRTNSALIHTRAKENEGGNASQYLYEMLSIAAQANIDEEAIITYTINGLPGSREIKAHMFEADNLKAFKKKLDAYEIQYAMRECNINSSETLAKDNLIPPGHPSKRRENVESSSLLHDN